MTAPKIFGRVMKKTALGYRFRNKRLGVEVTLLKATVLWRHTTVVPHGWLMSSEEFADAEDAALDAQAKLRALGRGIRALDKKLPKPRRA